MVMTVAREIDGIRELVAEQVDRIEKLFPGKNYLRQNEIADAFGISTDSVRRWYGVGGRGIDVVSFAWLLARQTCRIEKEAVV